MAPSWLRSRLCFSFQALDKWYPYMVSIYVEGDTRMTETREANWRCWFRHKLSLKRFHRANGEVRYLLRCERCPWLEITREDPRQRVRRYCWCRCHARLDNWIPDMVSIVQNGEAHDRGNAVSPVRSPMVSTQARQTSSLSEMPQSVLGSASPT